MCLDHLNTYMKTFVEIYTDGACKGNPGPGGWGAILMYKGSVKEIWGFENNTTNNRMELLASIAALESINTPGIPIKLHTDSKYLQQGITNWLPSWLKNNWKGGKIKNQDLWLRLYNLANNFTIEWLWVKGHSDNIYNARADQLANIAIAEGKSGENRFNTSSK